ncbi:hypothetical protein BG004_003693 [Podila humilis]|nr:hypothetical protein BG004_003693 [Podila humilis]
MVAPTINDVPFKARLPNLSPIELGAQEKPTVLISGAGIGGLTLAILLHRAGVPFQVFEKAREIRPLGKDGEGPVLYDFLLTKVPRGRIHFGKKILAFAQNEDGVTIKCADKTTYSGHILVGADGAYSAVRQNLYRELKTERKLPESDDGKLPFNCICLVGQTSELDPAEFPGLGEPCSQFNSVLGDSTMCTDSTKYNDSFRITEWGPEEVEALAREACPFKVPGGRNERILILEDYIQRTPRDSMSKVVLEEKVFET